MQRAGCSHSRQRRRRANLQPEPEASSSGDMTLLRPIQSAVQRMQRGETRRTVVSARVLSHEWCEVSLKIDRATVVSKSRRGVREHSTKRTEGIFHRPCTTHHNTPTSTARVGALRPMPYCLGIGSTRVGPGRTPTVHPC